MCLLNNTELIMTKKNNDNQIKTTFSLCNLNDQTTSIEVGVFSSLQAFRFRRREINLLPLLLFA